jgi:hypothetical protein
MRSKLSLISIIFVVLSSQRRIASTPPESTSGGMFSEFRKPVSWHRVQFI